MSQFNTLSSDVESTTPLTVEAIILGFGTYFPSFNSLSKKKRAMRRGTRNPHGLKVRHYMDNLIDLNEYLDLLTGANITDKMVMTELNDFF